MTICGVFNRIEQEIQENLNGKFKEMSFSNLIRLLRDLYGLKQYRAAEYCKITAGRLKNLETGYFRTMPDIEEIKSLAELYNVPSRILIDKAFEYIDNRREDKKIRIIKDGSSAFEKKVKKISL